MKHINILAVLIVSITIVTFGEHAQSQIKSSTASAPPPVSIKDPINPNLPPCYARSVLPLGYTLIDTTNQVVDLNYQDPSGLYITVGGNGVNERGMRVTAHGWNNGVSIAPVDIGVIGSANTLQWLPCSSGGCKTPGVYIRSYIFWNQYSLPVCQTNTISLTIKQ